MTKKAVKLVMEAFDGTILQGNKPEIEKENTRVVRPRAPESIVRRDDMEVLKEINTQAKQDMARELKRAGLSKVAILRILHME